MYRNQLNQIYKNMKYLLILIFSSVTTIAQTQKIPHQYKTKDQNYELTYIISMDKEGFLDKIKTSNQRDKKSSSYLIKSLNQSSPVKFKIIVNSKNGYSFRPAKLKRDDLNINLNNLIFRPATQYYLNFESQNYIFKKDLSGKEYYVDFKPKKYKIDSKKTKIINGYNCYLARLKSNEILKIWFTTDIPLSVGPLKYLGLPGVVVQAKISNFTYINLKSIKLTSATIKKLPKTAEVISQEEYREITKKLAGSLFEDANN